MELIIEYCHAAFYASWKTSVSFLILPFTKLLIPFIDVIIDLLTVQPEMLPGISNGLRLNSMQFLHSAVITLLWNYPLDEIRVR